MTKGVSWFSSRGRVTKEQLRVGAILNKTLSFHDLGLAYVFTSLAYPLSQSVFTLTSCLALSQVSLCTPHSSMVGPAFFFFFFPHLHPLFSLGQLSTSMLSIIIPIMTKLGKASEIISFLHNVKVYSQAMRLATWIGFVNGDRKRKPLRSQEKVGKLEREEQHLVLQTYYSSRLSNTSLKHVTHLKSFL